MRNKKKGFTLAEVLITLGVIGVIAAVTLPALKADIDKNIMSQSLKTTLSVLKSGFAQMKAQEDVDDLRDTVIWSDLVTADKVDATASQETLDDVKKQLGKYFKIDKMSAGLPANVSVYDLQLKADSTMDNYLRFYLANSSAINLVFYRAAYTANCENDFCNPVADLILDVNGDKGPNVYGKDIFRFYLGERGDLFPYGSEAVNAYKSEIKLWSDNTACAGKEPEGEGFTCTARVIDEAYSINYK